MTHIGIEWCNCDIPNWDELWIDNQYRKEMARRMSDSKMTKVGALWQGETKNGNKCLKGEIDGKRIIVFENGFKESDKHPDYIVYLSGDGATNQQSTKPAQTSFRNTKRSTDPNDGKFIK